MSRICILGGGFGGLYTALQLCQLPWTQSPEITLIDRSDRFVFTPLMYELITEELETWEIAPTFSELLSGTGIKFHQGEITDIDITACQVTIKNPLLHNPLTLTYDRLVVAVGGETPIDLVSGALEYAIPFRTLTDAHRLLGRLQQLEATKPEKIRVCIAGAGASGVELACKISDRLQGLGRVRIIDRNTRILPNSPDSNRLAAEKALASRDIWTDLSTNVAQIGNGEITLNYTQSSDILPVDIVMWTVGSSISKLGRDINLPHSSSRGQILIEPTLQVQGNPHIFALGDVAECRDATGQVVPATAQVAFQQAQYCARNIWASLNQSALLPFTYLPLGEFISLGKENAAMSIFGQFGVEGLPALVARRLAYLLRLPTPQHQLRVGINWLARPMRNFFKI